MSSRDYFNYKGRQPPIDTADLGGDITTFGESLLTSANSSVAQTNLSLVPGVNVQAYDVNTSKLNVAQTFTAAQTFGAGVYETKIAMTDVNFNLLLGNYFTKTATAGITFTANNVPSSGNVGSFILELTNGGAYTMNWTSLGSVKWVGGSVPSTAPYLTVSGTDVLGFYTHDGGTNWRGFVLGRDIK